MEWGLAKKKDMIPWEQSKCRICQYFPNCPVNGDIRGTLVIREFAVKCPRYIPRKIASANTGKHVEKRVNGSYVSAAAANNGNLSKKPEAHPDK